MKLPIIIVAASLSIGGAYGQEFWQQTSGPTGVYADTRSLAVDSTGFLFAGTWNAGFFRSSNNGTAWIQAAHLFNPVLGLSVDYRQRLYAGILGNGVFRSTDQGSTWAILNSGLTNLNVRAVWGDLEGQLLAGAGSGIFRSSNDGENWSVAGASMANTCDFVRAANGHIFASAGNGAFRSTDGGVSWSLASTGMSGISITRVRANSTGDLFATTLSAGVFKSTNNGDLWFPTNNGITCSDIRSLVVNSADNVFAGTFGCGVFRSVNNGESWNTINTGLSDLRVMDLAIDSGGYLLAATGGAGVFRSTRSTTLSLPSQVHLLFPANGATIEGDSALLVWERGTPSIERYWVDIATDSLFLFHFVDSTIVDTSYNAQLLANRTYWWKVRAYNAVGWGPFSTPRKFTISTTGVPTQGTVPSEFFLGQNYPNPFNPETEIRYDVPLASHVNIRIFDIVGREVATLINELKSPGSYVVRWAPALNASGVYYYRMTAGEFSETKKMMLLK